MTIKDQLFIETDNACAYCGKRGKENLTIHHINETAKSKKKDNNYDNLIVLCHNCHTRYHSKKGISKDDIIKLKLHLIVKTLTIFGFNAIKMCYRNTEGVISMPFLLYHLVDLGYLSKQEEQMGYGSIEATSRFEITKKGRDLYDKWFTEN